MSSFEYFPIVDEFRMLSSYLEFGHKNLIGFKQRLTTDLDESIANLRESEGISSEKPNDEIIGEIEAHVDLMFALEDFPIEDKMKPFLHISSVLEGLEFAKEYDNIFYATVVIMAYSCFERGLIKICDLQESKKGQSVLTQARNYLDNKLKHKIDYEVWRELKFIRWLRNTIVHSGMSFSLDDSLGDVVYESWGYDALVKAQPELINYLKANEIYIKEIGAITLNLKYCKHVIEFAQKFFAQVEPSL